MTRVALKTAIVSAATAFRRPRSKNETVTVAAVRSIRVKKMTKYTVFGTMCSGGTICSGICAGWMTCSTIGFFNLSFVPPYQVEQRKQKDPHDVHKVPVEPAYLDGHVIFRGKSPPTCQNDEHPDQSD